MIKKILGLAATAALALGATAAQATTITDIGTVTGPGQPALEIPNTAISGSFSDTFSFTVNSAVDLRLESTISFVSYVNVSPFTVQLKSCTDNTCASTSLIGTYDPVGNSFRSYFLSPIANGTYEILVSGNASATGNSYSGQATFFAVPEPATLGLLGLGLAGVGFVRRRRAA